MAVVSQRRMMRVLNAMGDDLVTAEFLAKRAGCSERTVYRCISELRASGHKILSEAGAGYLLRRRAPAAEAETNG